MVRADVKELWELDLKARGGKQRQKRGGKQKRPPPPPIHLSFGCVCVFFSPSCHRFVCVVFTGKPTYYGVVGFWRVSFVFA